MVFISTNMIVINRIQFSMVSVDQIDIMFFIKLLVNNIVIVIIDISVNW